MKLVCRVDANKQVGFGHFSRTLNLYRQWIKYGKIDKVLFVGNFDGFTLDVLNQNQITYLQVKNENFNIHLDLLLDFDIAIFDSYNLDQNKINQITASGLGSILIDDECRFNYQNIDCVINFRFEASKVFEYNSRNKLLGQEFLLVKPEMEELRRKRKQFVVKTDNILLFLGGGFSDPKITSSIIKGINTAIPSAMVYLISAIESEIEGTYNRIWPTFTLETILENMDVVISGGGIIKYEAAFCLIPTASFSTSLLQFEDSKILEKYCVNENLGLIGQDNLDSMIDKLAFFLTDTNSRQQQIMSNINNFPDYPGRNTISKILPIFSAAIQ